MPPAPPPPARQLGRDGRFVPMSPTGRYGAEGSAHRSLALQMLSSFLVLVLGDQAWGARSRTHLDTAIVSIPVCTGDQPLQWAWEAPTVLPGRTLAVHDLEGLGMVRKR